MKKIKIDDIKKVANNTTIVDVFGLQLTIPKEINGHKLKYLTIDGDGTITLFKEKPFFKSHHNFWMLNKTKEDDIYFEFNNLFYNYLNYNKDEDIYFKDWTEAIFKIK